MEPTVIIKHTNRLIDEPSPYLQQHAHNPVHWYPWSDEAFEKAKQQDKPVFLSIGYSSCHWCHVMAHESFEDKRIADIMNKHFVNIKVDREERPDIDNIYMNAVQIMTGSGGWPLSAFLTPDGKIFFGGTYFPPKDSYGRPGFEKILLTISDAWNSRRDEILSSADNMNLVLRGLGATDGGVDLSVDILEKAYTALDRAFDQWCGGFGGAPKFPQPTNLLFLLTYHSRTNEPRVLQMVEDSLKAMSRGGIYDQLGGGFHRYATDTKWLVPHFEKMLYDQALLSLAFTRAYQVTGNKDYAKTARGIFDYVLRDMTDGNGGFYSAEDADSEGKEGKFYVWTKKEIQKVLGKEAADIFSSYYGVTDRGNFEHNTNILNIKIPIEQLAKIYKKDLQQIEQALKESRQRLFDYRNNRIKPHLDDKIITAWNGLMIASMAYGGSALSDRRYIDTAQRAADFVLNNLYKNQRLHRFYRNGRAVGNAFLDDYAFMIWAMLELYEAAYDPRWLESANELAEQMIELFSDKENGGFFLTASDSENLIVRNKDNYDGAVPSGNSIAAYVLLKLGRITANNKFSDAGIAAMKDFSSHMNNSPLALTAMLLALDFYTGPTREIVIAGNKNDSVVKEMLTELSKRYLPRTVVLFNPDGPDDLEKLAPYIVHQKAIDNKAAAYVCSNYVCKKPVTTVEELEKIIDVNE